jgi:hypothetical protein
MTASQRFILSGFLVHILAICGCHLRNHGSVIKELPEETDVQRPVVALTSVVEVVVQSARPGANKEEIVKVIMTAMPPAAGQREKALRSAQNLADFILSGTEVRFRVPEENGKPMLLALTMAGAYARIVQ